MRLSTAALLLLLASCLSPGHGILEAHYTNLKCRCPRTSSALIHPNSIERIQVTPPGNGCPRTEVVVWTKAKKVLCLNPLTRWLQKVLKLVWSKNMFSTPPAPVSKRTT
ncbi:C-X-C motif chemokine 13 [Peromyscus californicus insignis]|uniref:C-X-C motif chemokine 13 n=1 Tax=Peromyscus californicus insignis TaxID=564181 RepID=UPI0022A6C9FE|nr:C-X-C motif chemokine 13 [Peromyscus californicus insignis]